MMSNSLVVELSDRVQEALVKATREEGLSPNELVMAALEDYLFIRKFRRLRERMLIQAPQPYTDDDIFERVS
jgi:hypothetical protein